MVTGADTCGLGDASPFAIKAVNYTVLLPFTLWYDLSYTDGDLDKPKLVGQAFPVEGVVAHPYGRRSALLGHDVQLVGGAASGPDSRAILFIASGQEVASVQRKSIHSYRKLLVPGFYRFNIRQAGLPDSFMIVGAKHARRHGLLPRSS